MSMLDRIGPLRDGAKASLEDALGLGNARRVEKNGHLAIEAGLITDASAFASARPTAWQAVQAARHIGRPHALDIIARAFDRFQELHGDRAFRDDPAIVGGIAELAGRPVVVIGQQKGASTEENIERNFGMPYPEGYRKAMRLYRLAEKFHLPLVTLIDTPGAYPGPEAEERGQAEAIASSIHRMTRLATPIVAVVLGEGGSGGALALGVADVVLALENATYSVISPEGCAAILWRSAAEAERAAEAMKLAGPDLLETGVVDALIREPAGGAHTDHDATAAAIKTALVAQLERLTRVPIADLLSLRYERFRAFGAIVEPGIEVVQAPPMPWWRRALRSPLRRGRR
ncbi:MAG: acetyl-CoA carboxylase carboxyltransferase subunit alpha [Chloroflexi bacterium 13_1_40CM_3_70_6]|nr:MAG: acetyl-CoA carboxylase carboxyltransferase subunit alpha [Chloroflexi bacterium 13_1_40CM_3_70_6]